MKTRFIVGYPCWDEQERRTLYPIWRAGAGKDIPWPARPVSAHGTIQEARAERDRLNKQEMDARIAREKATEGENT